MSRSLLLLAGLALAALAVVLILAPPPEESGPVMTDNVPSGEREEAPAAGVLETSPQVAAPAPPPVIERAESALAEASATPQPAVLPSLADGEGVRVEVVDAETGQPLPGAEVLVVDTGRVDEMALQEAMARTRDISTVLETLAERYRTRADGSVVIPHVEEMLAVAGQTPGRFAFLVPAVPDADDVLRIELKPKRMLRVRVLDENGAPASGVRVSLRVGGTEEFLGAESGEDGIAVLDNVGLIDSAPFRGEVSVGLSMLTVPPVEHPVDIDDLPEEPIELRMQPTGSLRVTLIDRDGQPASGDIGLVASVATEEEPDFRFGPQGPMAHTVAEGDGIGDFAHVGLGLRLAVEARSLADYQVWRGVVEGPTAPGQRVEFRLTPDLAMPTVVLRLQDEKGAPLARARVETILEQESGNSSSSSSSQSRTDAEGMLRYSFDEPPLADAKRRLELTREADDELPKLVGILDLSQDLSPGENDFGVLQLAPAPLLVSGTVLDPDGAPIRGAEISIQQRYFWDENNRDNFYWNNHWRLNVKTDREGRFVVNGLLDGEDLRVVASKGGLRDADAEFRSGTTDLVLRMLPGAVLAGRVLVDDGISLDALRISLRSRDPDSEGNSWQAGPNPEGQFRWDDLPDGIFDLEVTTDNGGELLYQVEGLQLRAGATNRDPRVEEIDLRGRLTGLHLEFVDSDGQRVREVRIMTLDLEPVQNWYAWDGEVDIVTLHAPLRLVAYAPGYRSAQLDGVAADREVMMRAGLSLELVLDNPGVVPAGWEVGAWLQPAPGDGGDGDGSYMQDEATFDSKGVATVAAQSAGTFDLQFYLGRKGGHSRWSTGPRTRIDIAEMAGTQRIQVSIDAEALARTHALMIEGGNRR